MKPIISVIIPVFNGAKTIKETVNSVLNQTFEQFELIIINSNSTDTTLEIISQFQDPSIKIFNYPLANVSVNRNRGFSHSIGEFITFLDADDLWTDDKLDLQYKALLQNPQAGVVYSWTDCIDEEGRFLHHGSHVQWYGNVYHQFLLDDFIGSGSNAMIRRDALMAVGKFDETLTNAEDTDMWLRLAANYDFVPVPKVQVFYRISTSSKSANVFGAEKSNLIVIKKAFDHPKSQSFQHLKRYRIANLYKYLSYKSLNTTPGKQNSFKTLQILCYALINDISLVYKPVIYKAFLRLIIMTVIPPRQAILVLRKFPKLSNISTFFGYIKTNYP
jgi:glycosyltransferase involved in cell wall biosynthesis